ncbi:MAG: alpha/beta fold hydrolase [Clostridiaceae bacterium]
MQYIFVHGLGQDFSSWNQTVSHMNLENKIACLDLYSFLKRGESSYSSLYKYFSQYCDEVSGPINLCGLSLGGVLALNYAIDNPSKVKSLILIAAQYQMPKVLLKAQNIIFRFMPKRAFEAMGISKNDFIQLTNSMMDIDFSGALNSISCPTLIICGEKDIANKKASMAMADHIVNSELHFVKGAGHEINKDNPKELADVLNSFL